MCMYECMCVCRCMHAYLNVHVCMSIFKYMYVCMSMYECRSACVCYQSTCVGGLIESLLPSAALTHRSACYFMELPFVLCSTSATVRRRKADGRTTSLKRAVRRSSTAGLMRRTCPIGRCPGTSAAINPDATPSSVSRHAL